MKEINIIMPSKLGDGLTLTPMFPLLHNQGYRINLFCSEYNRIIFEDNPYINNLVVLPRSLFKNFRFPVLPKLILIPLVYIYSLRKQFKKYKGKLTFILNSNVQSYLFGGLLSRDTRAMNPVYGFMKDIENIQTEKQLYSYQIFDFFEKGLGVNGKKEDLKYKLYWEEKDLKNIKKHYGLKQLKENFVWYNIGATLPIKEISEVKNIEYLEKLLSEGNQILLTDNFPETKKIENILSKLEGYKDQIVTLGKRLSLKDIYNLSKYAKEFRGPDSGISHIISINCKSYVFFTLNTFRVWAPLQKSEVIFTES